MKVQQMDQNKEVVINFTAPEARILIVDDSATNLEVASWLLSPYKMHIDTSPDGYDAIKKLQDTYYDLILMDHLMPEIDGIETVHYIRKVLDTKEKKFTIVALSANTMHGAREFFIENGMDDFLAKPFDSQSLYNLLLQYLPPEKQMPMETNITFSVEKPAANIEIEGVDVAGAIVRCGNDINAYKAVLSVFYLDGLRTLPTLKNLIESDNLKDLNVLVHALKSACANIGAQQESQIAAEIEAAYETENEVFICDKMPIFIDHFEMLLQKLEPHVAQNSAQDYAPKHEGNNSLLHEKLQKLKEALSIFDSGKIDEIIDNLYEYSWGEQTVQQLEQIKIAVELFEYEEATAKVQELL